jgi:hypothetical protein
LPILPHLPINELKRRNNTLQTNILWSPVIAYKRTILVRDGFIKSHYEDVIIPFVAPYAFTEKEVASLYFKTFINNLIKEESIPKESINPDNSINENIIKPYIKSITIANLEQEKLVKEGRYDDWAIEEKT